MTQITDKVFAVEVPEGAINFKIDMGYLIYKVPNYKAWVTDDILADYDKLQKHLDKHRGDDDYKTGGSPLPPGTWRFLFTIKTATEEDARKVVEPYGKGWKDYNVYHAHKDIPYEFAYDSLESLLRSKKLDPKNNYALIEKLTTNGAE